MKVYQGRRSHHGAVVTVDGRALDPRWDLNNHSPDGFQWGYGGSGPAQLALAMVADHLGDDDQALELYQGFKFAVIAGLSGDEWKLTSEDIEQALERIRARRSVAGGAQ